MAFAFDEDVQEAVYSTEAEVQSVDNTYIIGVELDEHDFNLKILSIKEDKDTYYVTYSYTTISLLDYVWQDEIITTTLEVSKLSMKGKDLGLFIARQVGEIITDKLVYLKKVQKIEQESGVTVKKVATKYKGLVGKMFDPTEEVFPGYKPVVKEALIAAAQKAQLTEPFVSQIALPHVPSEAEIQRMVDAAYAAMLAGDVVATSTATSTDDGTDDSDGTDHTGTTTDGEVIDDGGGDEIDDDIATSTDDVAEEEPEPEVPAEPEVILPTVEVPPEDNGEEAVPPVEEVPTT